MTIDARYNGFILYLNCEFIILKIVFIFWNLKNIYIIKVKA